MKALIRRKSTLPKLLCLALFLALAPVALAENTWYVDGVNGGDTNDCLTSETACKTIGHAITLSSKGDTVMVAPAIYTENLTINFSLKIIGSGATTTVVDGGQDGYPVFIINSGRVVLSKLTIRNGWADGYPGGGVYAKNGTTTAISNSTISGNTTDGAGGGGIYNAGKLTISKSTISGNTSVENGYGGGIMNSGTLTVNNSTVSNNSSIEPGAGGGIMNQGSLTLNNVTISGNSARYYGGIYQSSGSATLQNSIMANNSGGNCGGGAMTSDGYNLSDDDTCNLNDTGDMNNTQPLLGKFGYHGGHTQTVPELAGSPTIDAGNPNGCTDSSGKLLTTDQRGYARPGTHKSDQRCDMGAFEKQTD